jgi:hypothetical protein
MRFAFRELYDEDGILASSRGNEGLPQTPTSASAADQAKYPQFKRTYDRRKIRPRTPAFQESEKEVVDDIQNYLRSR